MDSNVQRTIAKDILSIEVTQYIYIILCIGRIYAWLHLNCDRQVQVPQHSHRDRHWRPLELDQQPKPDPRFQEARDQPQLHSVGVEHGLLVASINIGVVSQVPEAISVYYDENVVCLSLFDYNWDAAKHWLIAPKTRTFNFEKLSLKLILSCS